MHNATACVIVAIMIATCPRCGNAGIAEARCACPTAYDVLKAQALQALAEGTLEPTPSREQRIDLAYGNAVMSNEQVTRAMVAQAVDAKPKK